MQQVRNRIGSQSSNPKHAKQEANYMSLDGTVACAPKPSPITITRTERRRTSPFVQLSVFFPPTDIHARRGICQNGLETDLRRCGTRILTLEAPAPPTGVPVPAPKRSVAITSFAGAAFDRVGGQQTFAALCIEVCCADEVSFRCVCANVRF